MRTKIVRLAGAGLVLGGLAMPLAMAADAIRLKVGRGFVVREGGALNWLPASEPPQSSD